ncbi:MAG: CocE/NonD family hydrolase, partial [Myxococcota bacterium]
MRTIQQFSTYLPMHDGALLAVEVYMPPGPGPFSTVLSPTRYYRALESSTWPGRQLAALLSKTRRTGARFVNAGYVWLDIDVRGSGASSGVRHCPWSPTEIDDLVTVLDWIVEQPWSNGRVGATGISYVGTACEMLATRGHPALQAIAPRFGLFDVYTDVLAPGGIPLRWFLASWRQVNDAFDRGDFHDVLAPALRFVVEALAEGAHDHRTPSWTALLASIDPDALQRRLARMVKPMRIGVRRVERARAALAMAIDEHKHNYNVEAQALRLIFRDACVEETDIYDSHPFWTGSEGTADRFSPHNYQEALRSAGVPCYSQSGWGDGAYAGAAMFPGAQHKLVAGVGDGENAFDGGTCVGAIPLSRPRALLHHGCRDLGLSQHLAPTLHTNHLLPR